MSIGARQGASFFQYRSRTEVVSGGASSASDVREWVSAAAPARPAAATEKPVVRKCRRFCMFASRLLGKEALRLRDGGDQSRGLNVGNGALPAAYLPVCV